MKSDSQLKHDVMAELQWDPATQPNHLEVDVKDGLVTLRGHLPSYAKWHAAERAARRVSGVESLLMTAHVQLMDADARGDEELANAAFHALEWNSTLPQECIQVEVRNGWVTLKGMVEWNYQRETAERTVRDLIGVKSVFNMLGIAPQLKNYDLPHEVHQALARLTFGDLGKMHVLVEGSHITLSGQVRSWCEREAAQAAAWSAAGITHVHNELSVSPECRFSQG